MSKIEKTHQPFSSAAAGTSLTFLPTTDPDAARARSEAIKSARAVNEKDDPYAAFADIRARARSQFLAVQGQRMRDADGKAVTHQMYDDEAPEFVSNRIALALYISEAVTEDDAKRIWKAIHTNSVNEVKKKKDEWEAIYIIQTITRPKQDDDGLWVIRLNIASELSFEKARDRYRQYYLAEGIDPDGELYADEQKMIDFVVRLLLQKNIEKILETAGYDDLLFDNETLSNAIDAAHQEALEKSLTTSSAAAIADTDYKGGRARKVAKPHLNMGNPANRYLFFKRGPQ
ncbi:MAG: hypothetical protein AAGB32_04890 [Pseudomonadota bacterium]